MAQTVILSPTTSAAASSSFVVGAGEFVAVRLYGGVDDGDVRAYLERDCDGDWEPVRTGGSTAILTRSPGNLELCVSAPGTYRVSKNATDSAVGALVDALPSARQSAQPCARLWAARPRRGAWRAPFLQALCVTAPAR